MEMKKYFVDYLNSIEVTTVLKEKINEFYEFCRFICPEETKEIFIHDTIQSSGERTYGKICFFSENLYIQAGIFEKKDTFYITPLKNQIINLSIEKECYDFKEATEDSRLAVFITFPEEEKYLAATKDNCDHLRNIILEYLLPNLQSFQKTFLVGGSGADLLEAGEIGSLEKLEKQIKSQSKKANGTPIVKTYFTKEGFHVILANPDRKKKESKEKI